MDWGENSLLHQILSSVGSIWNRQCHLHLLHRWLTYWPRGLVLAISWTELKLYSQHWGRMTYWGASIYNIRRLDSYKHQLTWTRNCRQWWSDCSLHHSLGRWGGCQRSRQVHWHHWVLSCCNTVLNEVGYCHGLLKWGWVILKKKKGTMVYHKSIYHNNQYYHNITCESQKHFILILLRFLLRFSINFF